MANRDYNGDQFSPGYIQWVEGGGVPDPYVPPPVTEPVPTPEQQLLYDHENRLRTMEGEPLLELDEFMDDGDDQPIGEPGHEFPACNDRADGDVR